MMVQTRSLVNTNIWRSQRTEAQVQGYLNTAKRKKAMASDRLLVMLCVGKSLDAEGRD